MAMYNPAHPGSILKDAVIEPQGCSIEKAADIFSVPPEVLRKVLDEKAPVNPKLASKLEQNGISTARAWLAMQANRNVWVQRQRRPRLRGAKVMSKAKAIRTNKKIQKPSRKASRPRVYIQPNTGE